MKHSTVTPWQSRKAATAKALRSLRSCEYDNCTGRGMGWSDFLALLRNAFPPKEPIMPNQEQTREAL